MDQKRANKVLMALATVLLLAATALILLVLRPQPAPVLSEIENSEIVQDVPSSASPSASSSPQITPQVASEQVIQVTKVFDGDTIEAADGNKIRLIGVDTPETVDPRRPVGCFGKEASQFTKQLLTGKMVRLEKDISETDKYDRRLRYVFLQTAQGEVFVNDVLARQGYAQVKTYPPDVKYQTQFLEAQREAQEAGRGLWSSCKQ